MFIHKQNDKITNEQNHKEPNFEVNRDDWGSNDNQMDDEPINFDPPINQNQNSTSKSSTNRNDRQNYQQNNDRIIYNPDPNTSQNKDGFRRFQHSTDANLQVLLIQAHHLYLFMLKVQIWQL